MRTSKMGRASREEERQCSKGRAPGTPRGDCVTVFMT